MSSTAPGRARSQSSEHGDAAMFSTLKPLAWLSLIVGIFLALVAGALTFAASYLLEEEYQSSARVLPPALYSAPSRVGIFYNDPLSERMADQLSVRYQSDIAMTVLKSSTILDTVVAQEDLSKHFGMVSARTARDKLLDATRVSSGRDGVIVIQVTDRSSAKAASIANAYLDTLERYVVGFLNTNARARAEAIRMQLTLEQQRLKELDGIFIKVQSRTGIVKLAGDGAAASSASLTDLRQRLAVRDAQLLALAVYATESNPGYRRISAEAAGLRAQIASITGPGRVAGSTIEQETEYQRALRDVRSSEEAVDGLRKQLKQAEFEAISKLAGLQIIERASPNELRSGPRRSLMAAIAALSVLLVVVLWFLWRVRRYRLAARTTDTLQPA